MKIIVRFPYREPPGELVKASKDSQCAQPSAQQDPSLGPLPYE